MHIYIYIYYIYIYMSLSLSVSLSTKIIYIYIYINVCYEICVQVADITGPVHLCRGQGQTEGEYEIFEQGGKQVACGKARASAIATGMVRARRRTIKGQGRQGNATKMGNKGGGGRRCVNDANMTCKVLHLYIRYVYEIINVYIHTYIDIHLYLYIYV